MHTNPWTVDDKEYFSGPCGRCGTETSGMDRLAGSQQPFRCLLCQDAGDRTGDKLTLFCTNRILRALRNIK